MRKHLQIIILPITLCVFGAYGQKQKSTFKNQHDMYQNEIHHRTVKAGALTIFYREAGPKDAPVILLLHGYPTSSFMFRKLIPTLAKKYHVIAPDLPGFGYTESPDPTKYNYTFDKCG